MPSQPPGRLHPVRPTPGLGEHRREARRVCPKTAAAGRLLTGGHRLDRGGPLVRVHPDHHATALAHCVLLPSPRWGPIGAGGHRFYQQGIPFFSLSRPSVAGAAHAK
jgi:hypothetical protein